MKILGIYLPQYHQIMENDNWWGTGYTEWSAVKNAKPVYKKHIQPKVPLDNNYYDLSDETGRVWEWQANLARKYGLYGFCIYHYWFEGKMLLEKPMEILLKHKEININYCVCWANESWTRTWYGLEKEVLMNQGYGDEADWDKHFEYLLPFFMDDRYIKVDGKPVINIYHSKEIECLEAMIARWQLLAKENRFNGVYVVSANTAGKIEDRYNCIDAVYNFEPGYSVGYRMNKIVRKFNSMRTKICRFLNQRFKTEILENRVKIDDIYKANVLVDNYTDIKTYYGTFPMWDNTPRRQYKGTVYVGASPDKFKANLQRIKALSEDDDFVYINAWNEWGEGAYLEPDSINGYAYLNAIKEVVT